MHSELSVEARIEKIISPSLGDLGYEIVRIKLMTNDGRKTLQVMIDRKDGVNIAIEDCETSSKQISALLDVEDPIVERYHLEVSSAGIDRPLTRLKDFDKYKGLEAKVQVFEKVDGQRNLRGRLVGIEGEKVILNLNVVSISSAEGANKVEIDFKNISAAKLVLTDELLALHENNNI